VHIYAARPLSFPLKCGSFPSALTLSGNWFQLSTALTAKEFFLSFFFLFQVVRILQARAEKLVVGPKGGRYRGSESREEELHEHLFYSQVKQYCHYCVRGTVRYRGSESREEELHEHLFYSQVKQYCHYCVRGTVRYMGSESREEELREHLFYSQVKQYCYYCVRGTVLYGTGAARAGRRSCTSISSTRR
jgi:hypothetical protein